MLKEKFQILATRKNAVITAVSLCVLLNICLGVFLYTRFSTPYKAISNRLERKQYASAVDTFQRKVAPGSSNETAVSRLFLNAIDDISDAYDSGTLPYTDTMESLLILSETNETVAEHANDARVSISSSEVSSLLAKSTYGDAIRVYNDCSTLDLPSTLDLEIRQSVDRVHTAWASCNATYETTTENLTQLESISNPELADYAHQVLLQTASEYILSCLASDDSSSAVITFNAHPDELIAAYPELVTDFQRYISTAVSASLSSEEAYTASSESLAAISELSVPAVSSAALEQLSYVTLEHDSAEMMVKANHLFDSNLFLEAMDVCSKIDPLYSGADDAQNLYEASRDKLLSTLLPLETEDDYSRAIADLESFVQSIPDPVFSDQLTMRKNELTVLQETNSIIRNSDTFYSMDNPASAFNELHSGLNRYPDNEKLQSALAALQKQYISDTTEKAYNAAAHDDYNQALDIVEAAQAVYPCSEFDELWTAIDSNQGFLQRAFRHFMSWF